NEEDEEILQPQHEVRVAREQRPNENGGRRRRRRSRGGRDRDRPFSERSQDGQRDQHGQTTHIAPEPSKLGDSESANEDANAGIPDASLRMQQQQPGSPGEGGGRRRRRRRRRGRRGQGNGQNEQQIGTQPTFQERNSAWDDRFGTSDEIDTTP